MGFYSVAVSLGQYNTTKAKVTYTIHISQTNTHIIQNNTTKNETKKKNQFTKLLSEGHIQYIQRRRVMRS
jgi:hypothetical protein